jgi:hypothetical protein
MSKRQAGIYKITNSFELSKRYKLFTIGKIDFKFSNDSLYLLSISLGAIS